VPGTGLRGEAGRTPRMTFWRPVTAGEVRPLVTLSPASISTRSDDPGSEAGRIAELEKELVRLKGSQEEEEDHRHACHLGELFPTRSVTLAVINQGENIRQSGWFQRIPRGTAGARARAATKNGPAPVEKQGGAQEHANTRKRTQPAWTGEHSASGAISAGVGVERSGK
jgi:hypothetical protein